MNEHLTVTFPPCQPGQTGWMLYQDVMWNRTLHGDNWLARDFFPKGVYYPCPANVPYVVNNVQWTDEPKIL
jgi:hypothetical protein